MIVLKEDSRLYSFENGCVVKKTYPFVLTEDDLNEKLDNGAMLFHDIFGKKVEVLFKTPEREVVESALFDFKDLNIEKSDVVGDNRSILTYLTFIYNFKSRNSVKYPDVKAEIAFKISYSQRLYTAFCWYNFIAYDFNSKRVNFETLKSVLPSIYPKPEELDKLLSTKEINKESDIDSFLSSVKKQMAEIGAYNLEKIKNFKEAFENSIEMRSPKEFEPILIGDDRDQLYQINKINSELRPSPELLAKHKEKIAPIHAVVQFHNRILEALDLQGLMDILEKKLNESRFDKEPLKMMKRNADFFIGHECNACFMVLRHNLIKLEEEIQRKK